MGNLKHTGVALMAIVALGAIVASVASANSFHFEKSPKTTLTVGANEDQKFLYESGGKTVKCTGIGGDGDAQSETATEFTFKPQYSGCTVDGIAFSSAQVTMNECDYIFTIDATKNTGATHVACNGSSQITVTVKVFGVSICSYHIGKQSLATTDYANNGSNNINVQPTLTGIVATKQGVSECGSLQSKTGTYTGAVEFKCETTGTVQQMNCQVGP
jgi:hypothetical protein